MHFKISSITQQWLATVANAKYLSCLLGCVQPGRKFIETRMQCNLQLQGLDKISDDK